jgi:pentatricopeptide repeat protein
MLNACATVAGISQVEGWSMAAGPSKVGLQFASQVPGYAAEGRKQCGISDEDLNTMLSGFAINGWANEALAMYDRQR